MQRVQQRTVFVVTPDEVLRKRLIEHLQATEWTAIEASGGAEAILLLNETCPEALFVDHWLPDLEAGEFLEYVATLCPATDVLHMDGSSGGAAGRSVRRNELLHVLRTVVDADAGRASGTGDMGDGAVANVSRSGDMRLLAARDVPPGREAALSGFLETTSQPQSFAPDEVVPSVAVVTHLPDLVGDAPAMRDLNRMVRLVAPHVATVLILGETGTGKELVAKAVHRLSSRASKPFMVLNCAAIPEQLLEAELFGHTRGAFTGAVTSRMGRIEAAHGGTLFLDEIGEMPLALQAKMLRFLESGEVQRVGDNETARVDVRIIAATHQPLLANTTDHRFRLDLYHRLAVFPVEIAPLRERREDIPMLVQHFLCCFAGTEPRKDLQAQALHLLYHYEWSGNVRELSHVLQRAVIMAGNGKVITSECLRMREKSRD